MRLVEQAFSNVQDIMLLPNVTSSDAKFLQIFKENTSFLDNEIFNTYQSESEMMRYIKKLET